jgi:ABC-type molybdate transport system substrate-binding protein
MRALRFLPLVATTALCLAALGCPKPPAAPVQQTGRPAQPVAAPLHVSASGQGQTVVLWAEPTLSDMLEQLKPELEKRGALKLKLEYRDSTAVEAALSQGAPDSVLYPDLGLFAKLTAAKAIDEVTVRTVAGDRLTVACRHGEDWTIDKLFDLYKLRFKRLGLAPQGSVLERLGIQALTSDGTLPRVSERLKYMASAADLQQALKRDEVQLIFTYASTVAQNPQLGVCVLVDPGLHEDIRYKAAALAGKASQPGVMELLRLLGEDSAVQQLLSGLGYVGRADAMVESR